MSKRVGLFTRLWTSWKSLDLPWRKQRLAGIDLSGTTFWESKELGISGRKRRIAKYPSNIQYSEVQLSPMWLQWLRHTRPIAPTIEEQQFDAQRQIELKHLAQLADDRWNSKQSYLDKPQDTAQPGPVTEPIDKGGYTQQEDPKPWKPARGPSEEWQPTSWQPGTARR